jgi:hypothetical protein
MAGGMYGGSNGVFPAYQSFVEMRSLSHLRGGHRDRSLVNKDNVEEDEEGVPAIQHNTGTPGEGKEKQGGHESMSPDEETEGISGDETTTEVISASPAESTSDDTFTSTTESTAPESVPEGIHKEESSTLPTEGSSHSDAESSNPSPGEKEKLETTSTDDEEEKQSETSVPTPAIADEMKKGGGTSSEEVNPAHWMEPSYNKDPNLKTLLGGSSKGWPEAIDGRFAKYNV